MSAKGSQQQHFWNVLFTKEDVGNIHKILGISCLASFVYRYSHFGKQDCHFGRHHPFGTVIFVIHHLALNVSSFMFKLPEKRIVSGYRLWPEARLHALVFVGRSLAFMMLFYAEDVMMSPDVLPTTKPWHWMNLVIVLGTCAAADAISSFQTYPSRTIRDLEFPPLWKWFFSTVQFVATAICLVGTTPRRYTYHLNFVAVVQCNAFLMTLRRKNLASHTVLMYVYAGLLLVGLTLTILDDQYSHCVHATAVIGIATAMIRFHWNMNKYVLWTLVGILVHYLRDTGIFTTNVWWVLGHCLSWGAAMVLGYRKTTISSSKATTTKKSAL